MVVLFRMHKEEKEDLLKKLHKMEKFSAEISEMLEECMEVSDEYDNEDEPRYRNHEGRGTSVRNRYDYRRMR